MKQHYAAAAKRRAVGRKITGKKMQIKSQEPTEIVERITTSLGMKT